MAISAIALFVMGTALTLGLRTWVQWRCTQDTGHRHESAVRFSPEWWSQQLVLVTNILVAAGPVAALCGLDPLSALDHGTVNVTGTVVTVAAIVLTVVAQFHMGDSWRIGVDQEERTALVVGGFFEFARNPIFTGFVAVGAGLAMMVPNVVSLAGLVTSVVSVQVTVRLVEEPYLLATHQEAYLRYASRVGRFVPGVGRLRTTGRYAPGGSAGTGS